MNHFLSETINFVQNILNQTDIGTLILFFVLRIFSTTLGTTKTILVSNKAKKITYIIVAIDAFVVSKVLKMLVANDWWVIPVYVLSSVIGTYLGNKLESKIAIGYNEIEIFLPNQDVMFNLQDNLIAEGYSSTAYIGNKSKNKKRYSLKIQIKRKNMKNFREMLLMNNIVNPNMVIKQIKDTSGTIRKRIEQR